MASALVMPLTAIGTEEPGDPVDGLAVVPSPSCPSTFRPQHCTVPSPRSAQACSYPPLTATAPESPLTATGTAVEMSKVLSPILPESPAPQHCTVPSPRSAQPNPS